MTTLLAVGIALLLFFFARPLDPFAYIPPVVGMLFLILLPFVAFGLVRSVQKTAYRFTPLALTLLQKDHFFLFSLPLTLCFSLLSIAFPFLRRLFPDVSPILFLSAWFILLGIAIDGICLLVRKGLGYGNPVSLITHFSNEGKQGVRNENTTQLLESIDGLTEMGVGGIKLDSLSMTALALDKLQDLWETFLLSCKSIAHAELERVDGRDKISFTLLYVLQRLELMTELALGKRNEPILGEILADVSKILLAAARFDLSLTLHPIHSISKLAQKAAKEKMTDPPIKATCGLVSVGEAIPQQVDLAYADLKPTYFALLRALELISEAIFRQDKETPFPLLKRPFLDLEALFLQEPLQSHQDGESIRKEIARKLDRLTTLETVMNTLPTFSEERSQNPSQEGGRGAST